MTDPTLFDAPAARAARDVSIDQADRGNAMAKARWMDVIHTTARRLHEFTTDDVIILGTSWGVPMPKEGRAFGPFMQTAKANGWCIPTDRVVNTARVSRHAAPIRVWKSLVHRGTQETTP